MKTPLAVEGLAPFLLLSRALSPSYREPPCHGYGRLAARSYTLRVTVERETSPDSTRPGDIRRGNWDDEVMAIRSASGLQDRAR